MTRTTRFRRMLLTAGIAVVSAAALSSIAWAAISSTSGQVLKITPPPSVELHMLESNTTQFTFDERQCVTLAAALTVSISTPGLYDQSTDLTPGRIPAGTKVSSHFIQADKIGESAIPIALEGTLTTDAPILGVIVRAAHLDRSDFLGAIGTVYPTGHSGRVIQLLNQDWVVLDPSLRSVTVHTVNRAHADQVRVVTACRLPPPPPTGFQGCTPGYWKQDQHFDSWQTYSPNDKFNAVFSVSGPLPNNLTLLDALNLGGGGVNALARHAVAGLLSSVNSAVDYGLTPAEVIARVQAAIANSNATVVEAAKNELAALNEKGCPLN
jgi:hypothetical protein